MFCTIIINSDKWLVFIVLVVRLRTKGPAFASLSLLQESFFKANLHPSPGPDYRLKSSDKVAFFQKVLAVANVCRDVLQELSIPRYILV